MLRQRDVDEVSSCWDSVDWDSEDPLRSAWEVGTVTFFDWDDTLLPASAIRSKGLEPGKLSPETLQELRAHARLVLDVLT